MNIKKLKAAALAATPGKWQVNSATSFRGKSAIVSITTESNENIRVAGLTLSSGEVAEANTAFIAAANPAAILELIAENERLRAAVESGTQPVGHVDMQTPGPGDRIRWTNYALPHGTPLYAVAPAPSDPAAQEAEKPQRVTCLECAGECPTPEMCRQARDRFKADQEAVREQPVVTLPERVIDTLWQAAGLSTYHPNGSQLKKLHTFAHNVTKEVLGRLPTREQPAAEKPKTPFPPDWEE